MSADLIVQVVVTGLILAGTGWLLLRQYRQWAGPAVALGTGDTVSLVRSRHIRSGADVVTGEATSAAGGRAVLEHDRLVIERAGGLSRVRVDRKRIRNVRSESMAMVAVVLFDVDGEDRYWALWLRRPQAPAFRRWLEEGTSRQPRPIDEGDP